MNLAFDTLAYAKRLKAAGVPDTVAEVQSEALAEIVEGNLATKVGLAEVEAALRRDIKELETSLKRDIKELETSLKRDTKELELRLKHDLTLRLGGMLAAGIAIPAALIKLL